MIFFTFLWRDAVSIGYRKAADHQCAGSPIVAMAFCYDWTGQAVTFFFTQDSLTWYGARLRIRPGAGDVKSKTINYVFQSIA